MDAKDYINESVEDISMKNRILEINKLIQEKVSPSCAKKFGDYLFGEYEKWHGRRIETDTNLEAKYFENLGHFLKSFSMKRPKTKFEKMISDLMACKSSYPEILVPPSTELHRGTAIPFGVIMKYIPKDDAGLRKFKKEVKPGHLLTTSYTYTPKSKIQSWSTDIKNTFGFASMAEDDITNDRIMSHSGDISKVTLGCTLSTTFPPKEIVMSPEFMDSFRTHNLESEVVRVGGKVTGCTLRLRNTMDMEWLIKRLINDE